MKQKISIILCLVLMGLLALQNSIIKAHKTEINNLRMRVQNLEIVINHAENKMIQPKQEKGVI